MKARESKSRMLGGFRDSMLELDATVIGDRLLLNLTARRGSPLDRDQKAPITTNTVS